MEERLRELLEELRRKAQVGYRYESYPDSDYESGYSDGYESGYDSAVDDMIADLEELLNADRV